MKFLPKPCCQTMKEYVNHYSERPNWDAGEIGYFVPQGMRAEYENRGWAVRGDGITYLPDIMFCPWCAKPLEKGEEVWPLWEKKEAEQ